MKYIYSILIITLLACSPVRNRYMSKSYNNVKIDSGRISNVNRNQDKSIATAGLEEEANDTVYVKLPPIYVEEGIENEKRSLNAELDSAVYLFNNGMYYESCEKFNLLQETLKEHDSLYHEAVFYSAECLIVHNEYKLANRLLNEIMDEKISISLKQRVLLRQGHLLCALGDESTAQWYFDKLNSDYPNSIYIKLANCNALK